MTVKQVAQNIPRNDPVEPMYSHGLWSWRLTARVVYGRADS